jgi:beta-fructofuranosidase
LPIGTISPRWGAAVLRPYKVCGAVMASRRSFLKTSASMAALASARPKFSLLYGLNAASDDALQARLAADPLRPQFHLLPAKNWMNDPNGPIYWKGHYHMFFQYNPNAAVWGDMHWAHAVSDDMIHWRHLPIALAPTPGWDDADGCFTGSAVDDHGVATILYTGVKTVPPERATLRDGVHNFREVVCLATSADPQLRSWDKWKTPVIEPPRDSQLTGFRDPFLWRGEQLAEMGRSSAAPVHDRADSRNSGDWWYLGVASGVRKVGGNVRLYRSKDLRQWEYLHLLASGKWTEKESVNPVDSGEMWECPDFFPLGKKHVLLYSTAGGVYWETGELDPKELVFHSEKRGVLDYGAYYAQKTQLDAHGNRMLWGWITEKRSDDELRTAGWAGCMALPRVLSISADGGLEMRFAPAAQSLRAGNIVLPPPQADAPARRMEIKNLAGELAWQSVTGRDARFSLGDRSGEWFSVTLERARDSRDKLTVNDKSIGLPQSTKSVREFHLFLDGSVAELLCDEKYAITSRIYRTPDGPLCLAGADTDYKEVTSLEAWQLRAISPDRLTI